MQPDSLIPDPSNPQAWNRYSYVGNNPVNFNDPTGHKLCDGEFGCDDGGGGGGVPTTPSTGNGGNNDNDKIKIDLGIASAGAEWDDDNLLISFGVGTDSCDETCQIWAEAMGFGAFVVDAAAAFINGLAVASIDIALLVHPPAAVVLAGAWKMASPAINALATIGTIGWAGQGLLLGTNSASGKIMFSTDAPMLIDGMGASVKFSQDTMASGVLDLLGWFAPEPHSSAGVSAAGVAYDLVRNPSPSIFNYDAPMPSWFDFSASVTVGSTDF